MTGTSALPRRRHGGRLRPPAALIGGLATLFASLVLVTPASAAGNGEWSVDPAVPDGTSQNARRYFYLEGAAGTTVPDVVTLHNTSPAPLTLKLFGADAYNTPRDGGFALRTATDKQKDIGTWIKIAPENEMITLQPGEKRQVPFNIAIPPTATPGDHPGAVVALNTAIEGTQQQGQVKVSIQRQIGARVYLRVQGEALSAMDVQKVEVKRDAGFGEYFGSPDATITYRIVNRGNTILRPNLELRAEGLFGRELLKKSEPGNEILPGESVDKIVKWKDAPRLDQVKVNVKATTDDPKVKDSVSASYTAVPWPFLLTVALILVAGGLGWGLWRNQRKGGSGGDPAKPTGPVGPTDDTTVLPPVADEQADAKSAAHAEASGTAESTETAPSETPAEAEPKPAAVPAEAPTGAIELVKSEPENAEPEHAKPENAEPAANAQPADAEADDDEAASEKTAESGHVDAETTPAVTESNADTTGAADTTQSVKPDPVEGEPEPGPTAETTTAEADRPTPAPATAPAPEQAAADTPTAAPAAAAKPRGRRPKPNKKVPPARSRPEEPTAESSTSPDAADAADSADSAGVGR
jgi:WxL interacting protein linking bacterial and host surfaces